MNTYTMENQIKKFTKEEQAYGAFNGGEIIENKPLGFPQDGGELRPYSNLFYWANAVALKDSTIGLHPHQGFEILSFVLEGRIRHYDTQLKNWIWLEKGDVQIIKSGSGISHAEYMEQGARMFQIWFDPSLQKTLKHEASYKDFKGSDFSLVEFEGGNYIDYTSGEKELNLVSEGVQILRVQLNDSQYSFKTPEKSFLSIYVIEGSIEMEKNQIGKDDFVQCVIDEEDVVIKGEGDLFCIINPFRPSYPTYSEMMRERMRN